MSRQRAEEIRVSIWASGCWTYGCATPEEIAEIKRIWETFPGNYSFYDTIARMAREGS